MKNEILGNMAMENLGIAKRRKRKSLPKYSWFKRQFFKYLVNDCYSTADKFYYNSTSFFLSIIIFYFILIDLYLFFNVPGTLIALLLFSCWLGMWKAKNYLKGKASLYRKNKNILEEIKNLPWKVKKPTLTQSLILDHRLMSIKEAELNMEILKDLSSSSNSKMRLRLDSLIESYSHHIRKASNTIPQREIAYPHRLLFLHEENYKKLVRIFNKEVGIISRIKVFNLEDCKAGNNPFKKLFKG